MLSRRGFLKGSASTVIAGSILVTNPEITGAILNDNGVLVPTQPEVLIATEMPSKITKGGFEMWLTAMNVEMGPPVDITTSFDTVRQYIPTPNMEITIRGQLTGPTINVEQAIFGGGLTGKKVRVHFTLA